MFRESVSSYLFLEDYNIRLNYTDFFSNRKMKTGFILWVGIWGRGTYNDTVEIPYLSLKLSEVYVCSGYLVFGKTITFTTSKGLKKERLGICCACIHVMNMQCWCSNSILTLELHELNKQGFIFWKYCWWFTRVRDYIEIVNFTLGTIHSTEHHEVDKQIGNRMETVRF